ncbi:MAG: toxin-antitoxin system protein [Blastocatellales bacterium]
MQTIVEEAIEQYQRRRFLEGLNQDFKALKENAQAWQEELAERALWDNTLLDGVETK